MIQDVLIELQDDLASRIALRYACQLERFMPFNMQALHVPDLEEYGRTPGNGWVKEKWKDVVVENSSEKIDKMVKREFFYCHSDSDIKTVSGQRDQVIFNELHLNPYGFFMEGLLHSFEPDLFFQRLSSRLYRELPCPGVIVKNLVNPDLGAVVVGTPAQMPRIQPQIFDLCNRLPGNLDVLVCQMDPSLTGAVILENDPAFISGPVREILQRVERPGRIQTVKGSPAGLTGFIRDYTMVISSVPDIHDPLAQLLAMCPCPILFCRRGRTGIGAFGPAHNKV